MDCEIRKCIQDAERLQRKIANFQQLLAVRRDEFLDQNADFHQKLFCKVGEHQAFYNDKISSLMNEKIEEYQVLVSESGARLEQMRQWVGVDLVDPSKVPDYMEKMRSFRKINEKLLAKYPISMQDVLELGLHEVPGALDEFNDILDKRQLLNLSFSTIPTVKSEAGSASPWSDESHGSFARATFDEGSINLSEELKKMKKSIGVGRGFCLSQEIRGMRSRSMFLKTPGDLPTADYKTPSLNSSTDPIESAISSKVENLHLDDSIASNGRPSTEADISVQYADATAELITASPISDNFSVVENHSTSEAAEPHTLSPVYNDCTKNSSPSGQQNHTAPSHELTSAENLSHARFDLTPLLSRGKTAPIFARAILKLGAQKKFTPPEAYLKYPIGCTKNEYNGDMIVCDTRHEAVKIYSSAGDPVTMINGAEHPDIHFSSPSAVVVLDAQNFVVKDNSSLFRFNQTGHLQDSFIGRFKKLYGLSLNEQGCLLTLDLNVRPTSLLYTIDPFTGDIVKQVPFTVHQNSPGSKCRFMDYFDHTLVVVDLGAHQVYVCDENGQLKRKFGSKSRTRFEPGCFNEPSGVAIDARGNMLVGDSRNDRVQIWSANCDYLGDIKFSERIVRPSNIHLTLDGHLMVMNYIEHYITLFKLE